MATPTIEIIIAAQADQFKRELDAIKKRVASLENSLGGASGGVKKFTKQTNLGQNALRDFSRVVQDAPFGIIGVGNNIQELAGSFAYLSRQAGGTRAALSAMIASLSGPGGLILAVAAITTVMTVFAQRSRKAKDEVKSFADELDEVVGRTETRRKALDLQKSILKIQKEDYRGIILAQLELALLDLNRIKAIQEQNRELREQNRVNEDTITNLQIAGVLAQGVWDKTTDEIKQYFNELKDKAKELGNEAAGTAGEWFKLILESVGIYVAVNKKQVAGIINQKNAAGQQEKINEELLTEEEILERIARLREELRQANLRFGERDPIPDARPTEGLLSSLENEFAVTEEAQNKLVDDVFNSFFEKYVNKARETASKIREQEDSPLEVLRKQFVEQVNLLEADTIASGVSNLFGAVTEAIATGGNVLGAAAQSLLKTFGNFLTKYGTLLITYGKLTYWKGKLDVASLAGGPIAIAAGLAAIKVGIAATAAGAAISALASSGLFGAGGAGGVSSTGGGSTSVKSPSFAPTEQVVVFEIAGDKLIGVLNNTRSRNNRLSGSRIAN